MEGEGSGTSGDLFWCMCLNVNGALCLSNVCMIEQKPWRSSKTELSKVKRSPTFAASGFTITLQHGWTGTPYGLLPKKGQSSWLRVETRSAVPFPSWDLGQRLSPSLLSYNCPIPLCVVLLAPPVVLSLLLLIKQLLCPRKGFSSDHHNGNLMFWPQWPRSFPFSHPTLPAGAAWDRPLITHKPKIVFLLKLLLVQEMRFRDYLFSITPLRSQGNSAITNYTLHLILS